MTHKTMLLKVAASAGAAALLLTGCSGTEDPSGSGDTSAPKKGTGLVAVMEDWKGCWALDDLQPLQDYLGVESIGADGLINAAMGEGLDGEALTCSGSLKLATATIGDDDLSVTDTGQATVQMGVVPWESEEIAAESYAERLQTLEENQASSGIEHNNETIGELGGTWSESYYEASEDDSNKYTYAFGRSDDWILYLYLSFNHDPGLSVDQNAVYPFTEDELVDWIVNEYMPQTQADILSKIESEQ